MSKKKKALPDVDNTIPTHIEDLEGIDLQQAQKIAAEMPNMDSAEDQKAAAMARNLGKDDQPTRTIEGDDFRVNKKVEVETPKESDDNNENEEETTMQKNITIEDLKKAFAQLSQEDREKIADEVVKFNQQKAQEEEGGMSTYLKIGGGIAACAALGYIGYSIFSGNGNEETVQECAALLFA